MSRRLRLCLDSDKWEFSGIPIVCCCQLCYLYDNDSAVGREEENDYVVVISAEHESFEIRF